MSADRVELRIPGKPREGAVFAASTTASVRSGRLEFLDFMRGIAALAVLVEHGGYHFIRGFAFLTHSLFSFGKFGITLFFLVSGFLIPLGLDRRPELRRFWVLRFFRLYPLYWFSLAAALTLYSAGDKGVLTADFVAHRIRNTVINLTMLQGVLGVPHAIGLYYTLTIELIFYLVCTALAKTNLLKRAYTIAWIVLSAAALIAIGAPVLFDRRIGMAGLFYVVTLAVGAAIGSYYKGSVSSRGLFLLLAGVSLFLAAGTWLNYVALKKQDSFEHYTFVAVALPWVLGYALFLVLLAFRGLNYPRSMLYVGRTSYSLYLLHPLVLSFFRVNEGNTWGFVIFALTSLLFAAGSFQLIEQPAYQLGQRLAKSRLEPEITLQQV